MLGLDPAIFILLCVCLVCACAFEFVNGFHDTANAVATVIYTNSLQPWVAVIWSGFCNFLGVITGGIAVAMGILNLLPINALIDTDLYHGIAMILALLLSAIIWNLGTWWLGLPASSSHTLIGSIIGVGLAFSFIPESGGGAAVNWDKASETGFSLLISPVFGFLMTLLLVKFIGYLSKNQPLLFDEPKREVPPPLWVRLTLILTCTGVSFFHGRNDGQKGVGLVMLILIVIMPAYFAINTEVSSIEVKTDLDAAVNYFSKIKADELKPEQKVAYTEFVRLSNEMTTTLANYNEGEVNGSNAKQLANNRLTLRKDIMLLNKQGEKVLGKNHNNVPGLTDLEAGKLHVHLAGLKNITDYAPFWVTLMISLSLGIGTMVGWKRIVLTIGEKIGKSHLSYAQGASAELVAASTIALSSSLGLPVSTTHVLSSGIAGSMVATSGFANLQASTLRNILTAWVLTLPVTMLLAGGIFLLLRWVM